MTVLSLPVATVAFVCYLSTAAASAAAQWSIDTVQNQVVSSAPSDQNQPKVARAIDGGYWVSWLDGIGTGWDVRIQRYDAFGTEMLAPGGMLVADRGYSSTQDYGLDVALNGDALLAFRDDRSGSTEITAARIAPDGTEVYGPGGLTLSTGAGFVAAPKITRGRDFTFVAWTENNTVRVRSIDAGGNPSAVDLTWTPPVGSYQLSDLQTFGQYAIVALVHQQGGFGSPRHLMAQRVSPTGAIQWGATPLPIFDGGSLQFGNFPEFTVTRNGDSVFTWYSSTPTLQSFVQRVSRTGVERWAHNGVPVATAPGRVRVAPTAIVDEDSGDIVAGWIEQDLSQSQSGRSLQRINLSGQRLWSDAGAPLLPLGSDVMGPSVLFSVPPRGETLVIWGESPNFGMDRYYGARLDDQANVTIPRFNVASLPRLKSRLTGTAGLLEGALLAWSDGRNDPGDIYIQQIDFDATPGDAGVISAPTCVGVPNSTGAASQTIVAGDPVALGNRVLLTAIGLPRNSFSYFLTSLSPGFVAQPGGSVGNLCLGGAIGRFVGPGQIRNTDALGYIQLQLDLTMQPTPTGFVTVTGGQSWYFQAWHRDTSAMGATSNFSGAAAAVFQ